MTCSMVECKCVYLLSIYCHRLENLDDISQMLLEKLVNEMVARFNAFGVWEVVGGCVITLLGFGSQLRFNL